MTKTKKVLLYVTLCVLLVGLLAGCSSSGPSKDLLKKDMAEAYEDHSGWGFASVKEMNVVYSDCDDGVYEAEIEVYFYLGGKDDNENSKDLSWNTNPYTVNVVYKHYSKGGWKLMDIDIHD